VRRSALDSLGLRGFSVSLRVSRAPQGDDRAIKRSTWYRFHFESGGACCTVSTVFFVPSCSSQTMRGLHPNSTKVVATPKHFAVHSGPESTATRWKGDRVAP